MKRAAGLAVVLACAWASTGSADDFQVTTGGSIAVALAGATAGDRILVQQGTYNETLDLKNGVEIRGGYDAGFSEDDRDPDVFITTVMGTGTGPVITSGATVTSSASVDGLTITGGGAPGAVVITGGGPVFRDNRITGNHTDGIAGGVWITSNSTTRFEDNLIDDNSCGGSGGGLRTERSDVVLVGNTFDGNTAINGGGGAYLFLGSAECSLNTFTGCTAGEGGGGGLLLQNVLSGTLFRNTFTDSEARYGGGLMIRDFTVVTVRENTFTDNRAIGPQFALGGGGCVYYRCEVLFDNNAFEGCSSDFNGGGLYAVDSEVDVTGVSAILEPSFARFVDCTAVNFGGGMHLRRIIGDVLDVRMMNCGAGIMGGGAAFETSALTVAECFVEGCSAFDGGGLAFYTTLASGAPTSLILHCTIFGCSAASPTGAGGVLHSASGSNSLLYTMSACIVSHCPTGVCFNCTDPAGGNGGRPNIRCSTAFNATATPLANGSQCEAAFAVGQNRAGDPLYCAGAGLPELRDCSPDVNGLETPACTINTIPGRTNRGVTDNTCPCNLTTIEASTWGMIKAKYR